MRDLEVLLLESLIMGLWRSMTLPPSRMVLEEDDEHEARSVLRHMAVEASDAQKISIRFIF